MIPDKRLAQDVLLTVFSVALFLLLLTATYNSDPARDCAWTIQSALSPKQEMVLVKGHTSTPGARPSYNEEHAWCSKNIEEWEALTNKAKEIKEW